ncbi:U3-containing 90S pre-ribosomal complex subunit-domain containing protein [Radiomyces spectabilis]|uniref:U3-containing 90S pre-ribosomal complex subunit-domain containing protein n=1 Tax=Radiomyces spectabilis TaxID=64574 RepID=UPI002220F559|nr:U3-containing 90S pre-ribosomal complex subunit-domain containing protein [Radiomyces spectabilis]KAI8376043.1 U3-containing 90S pre-ribosomal complex subunit-domain containing protein [Radiomyces spectabilis]
MVAADEKKTTQAPVSADALDDGFDLEEIYSDNEEVVAEDVTGTKRKAPSSAEKKKNDKKKKKKAKISDDPFGHMNIWTEPVSTQYQYVLDRQKKALPDLSAVELEGDQALVESAFVDNEKFTQEHVLEALPNYIKFGVARHKRLTKAPTVKASPTALVITHAAVRAVDLVRALKEFSTTAKIAKLFAKHLKVEEQIQFLDKQAVHLGVGTPNRIKALVESGHLKLDQLELVVIDTERNAKRFNIFDNDSVRKDLFSFLGEHIASRMQNGQTKLGLF